jgi:cytoskeleton-associated protein 5
MRSVVCVACVVQALNVLMLKILENSNRNFTFSALLALLLDTPAELTSAGSAQQVQMQQARWADLVVKCLIKSTKTLPQVIEVRLLTL